MEEQLPSDVIQSQQVTEAQALNTPPRMWRWFVGGALGVILAAAGAGYWYWNATTFNERATEANEPLTTICCSSQPSLEYKRDSDHVYALESLDRYVYQGQNRVRDYIQELVGTAYTQNQVLAVLDGLDTNSFQVVGGYLVDKDGVYEEPLTIGDDIANGEAEYTGTKDGIAVFRYKSANGRWYHFDPVNSYRGWVVRDLVTGEFHHDERGLDAFLFGKPDPYSFAQVGRYYIDKDYVYSVTPQTNLLHVEEGIDPASLEVIGEGKEMLAYSLEGNDYYTKTLYFKDKDNVYVESLIDNLKIIPGANLATFEVVDGKVYYDAQDQNHKYLRGEAIAYNSQDLDMLIGKDGKDSGFARDKERIYYNNRDFVDESNQEYFIIASKHPEEVVPSWKEFNLDVDSFSVVGDGYIKDKNKVLFLGALQIALVKMADAGTFTIDDKTIGPDSYKGAVAKDAMHVYRAHRVIEGADPKTFERIDGNWAKDIDSVFAEANDGVAGMYEVSGVDPSSFAPLSFGSEPTVYGIAQNKIVCAHVGYIEADITSFEVTSEFSARDNDREYWGCDVYDPGNP